MLILKHCFINKHSYRKLIVRFKLLYSENILTFGTKVIMILMFMYLMSFLLLTLYIFVLLRWLVLSGLNTSQMPYKSAWPRKILYKRSRTWDLYNIIASGLTKRPMDSLNEQDGYCELKSMVWWRCFLHVFIV